jgi:pyridoxine 5-phosphate synthase
MPARILRLYVNIDHVATLRQARRGFEPSAVEAAAMCEMAGADGITAHLREDRRHIQDADIEELATSVKTYFNLEAACADEMIAIALRIHPQQVTLVPEKREEITTEGGLDVIRESSRVASAIAALRDEGIRTSLFIDPSSEMIAQSVKLGADAFGGNPARTTCGPGPSKNKLEIGTTLSVFSIAVKSRPMSAQSPLPAALQSPLR